jgi:hypothetical protein
MHAVAIDAEWQRNLDHQSDSLLLGEQVDLPTGGRQ